MTEDSRIVPRVPAVEVFVCVFAFFALAAAAIAAVIIPGLQLIGGATLIKIAATFEDNLNELTEFVFTLGLLMAVVAAGLSVSPNRWRHTIEERGPEAEARDTSLAVVIGLALLLVAGFLSLVLLIGGGASLHLNGPLALVANPYATAVTFLSSYLRPPFDVIAASVNWLLNWHVTVRPSWLHVFIALFGVAAQPMLYIELHPGERNRRQTRLRGLLFVVLLLMMVSAFSRDPLVIFASFFVFSIFRIFEPERSDGQGEGTELSQRMALEGTIFILPIAALVAFWLNQVAGAA